MPALFVDALTVIDFTFLHPGRGLVGESWIVDVELHGSLDEQGMVFDFGDVKKTIKRELDARADHRLVLPGTLPGLSMTTLADGNLQVRCTQDDGHLLVECPPTAVLVLPSPQVTPEALADCLCAALRPLLPANVTQIVLHLREEAIDGASYQYSHGLKKHQGACQRIAHGHRSRLRIDENGVRNATLEREWAQLLRDSYIGTRADLVDGAAAGHLRFAYTSCEGRYLLELPERQVQLIDSDSTVEHIAHHIASTLKQRQPGNRYRVKAFEGVGKGAIAVL